MYQYFVLPHNGMYRRKMYVYFIQHEGWNVVCDDNSDCSLVQSTIILRKLNKIKN
jgi:hypothetical protein